MAAVAASQITHDELERILERADPRVVVTSPRILRRVIKRDQELGGFGLQVPHPRNYVLDRDALLDIVDRDELRLPPGRELPDVVILLARPETSELRSLPRDVILVRYWRLLFHARVHAAIHVARRDHLLTEEMLAQRLGRLEQVELDEVRSVLQQDHRLVSPSDWSVYEEFAALFLELYFFAPYLLPRYFPSLDEQEVVAHTLIADVDARDLFEQTRPEGAPLPSPASTRDEDDEEFDRAIEPPPPDQPEQPDERRCRHLLDHAARRAEQGNLVLAAMLNLRAVRAAEGNLVPEARSALDRTLDRLGQRLREALHLDDNRAASWRALLRALLEPASRGGWSQEARLLYDLQNTCLDHERAIYSIDVVEWIVSLGRRSIKHSLPHQGALLKVKHLRTALKRVPSTRIADDAVTELSRLLHQALQRAESEVRRRFRPFITESLNRVGFTAGSFIEEVEQAKIVDQMLDSIVDRGYLNMALVRDIIARTRLKLPDLSGPGELLRGDQLIRLNRELAISLPDVYQRGEIYRRWLQRFSSLFFANRVGRWLTLFVFLPFGGAFMILTFLDYVIHPLKEVLPSPVHLANPASVLGTGVFLLGLLHWPWFRRRVADVFLRLGRALRWIFWDFPRSVFQLPVIRHILQSRWYLSCYQYIFKPLVLAGLVAGVLSLVGVSPLRNVSVAAAVFAFTAYLLYSRLGRHLEEATADTLVRTWQLIRDDLVLGFFRMVIDFFRWVLDEIDRAIYTVDEWLRFRSGESRFSMVVKAVMGVFWWVITYIVRFCIVLLIEPQINPIKHFPVVTVSHKLMFVILEPTARVVADVFGWSMGEALAVTGLVFSTIPGIFGFLAWELKENWKLYRANQSPTVDPILVGSHGETMGRLLRPGIHSGTVPKVYAKLRRRERVIGPKVRKYLESLHHVRESVERFVERDLLAVVARERRWGDSHLHITEVVLGTRLIRIEVLCPSLSAEPLWLDIELHDGLLLARYTRPGWLHRLSPTQRAIWHDALAGFYKRAGVSLLGREKDPAFGDRPLSWAEWADAWQQPHSDQPRLVPEMRLASA
jgi:hypothetical protein